MGLNFLFDGSGGDKKPPYPPHPDDKIPKSWLSKIIKKDGMHSDEVDRLPPMLSMFFAPSKSTLEKMQNGDELWSFSGGGVLSARAGVAIVRDGVIIHAEVRVIS